MSIANDIQLIVDNSEQAKEEMKKALEKAAIAVGNTAEKHAKEVITTENRVDTGYMRNSITYAVAGESTKLQTYRADGKGKKSGKSQNKEGKYEGTAPKSLVPAVFIGTNVEYARYQEEGTSKIAGIHFLKKAATEHTEEYKELVKDALKSHNF